MGSELIIAVAIAALLVAIALFATGHPVLGGIAFLVLVGVGIYWYINNKRKDG